MRIAVMTSLILSIALTAPGFAADTPAPDAAPLQAQVDDLSRELLKLHNAAPADQAEIMRDYWSMLQKQLQYVRHIPGVASRGCTDWTLQDPAVLGSAGPGTVTPCPLMIHDAGPVAGWEFPANMTERLFEIMMNQQLDRLRSQVTAITAETDSAKRLNLVRDHYESRYQDIQTVLGRSWMWAARDAAALPASQSMGAQLFGKYCSQCHSPPPPHLRTAGEWQHILGYMRGIIQSQSRVQVSGIQVPSVAEFDMITSYLTANAHPLSD
jgi:cytochrome c5